MGIYKNKIGKIFKWSLQIKKFMSKIKLFM